MKIKVAVMALVLLPISPIHADEQFFGFARGAETLPAHRWQIYQFVTLHEGKSEGTYYGTDFETEYEHGFTDRFQASLSLEQQYFYNQSVDGARDALDDKNNYRFGGIVASAPAALCRESRRSVKGEFQVAHGRVI
jgi:hypothetical protein